MSGPYFKVPDSPNGGSSSIEEVQQVLADLPNEWNVQVDENLGYPCVQLPDNWNNEMFQLVQQRLRDAGYDPY